MQPTATGHVPDSVEGHHVTQGFHDFLEEDGYLVLKEGEFVFVEYIGFAGQEQGWLYGYKYDVANHHGWFPERCIKKRNSPLRPRPSPLPSGTPVPPKPPLLTTKVSDVDTFARTATPPPDDEEILERAVTPPPDDEDMSEPWLAPEPCARMPPQRPAPAPRQPPPPAPKGTPITELPPVGFGDRGPPASAADCHSISEGLDVGRNLPMYQYCEELKMKVKNNRVVMVDAATGSGKSTLVPLCLAQQCLEENRGCRIVVTQPRRIAAKGLAARVSQQAGRSVGSLIGYRVGGHDKQDHPEALIVYVTVGHFLEALVHNPTHLDTYSHIVLDEVHERFVEADFLMALLRLSLSRPQTIGQRIIVMSATLQDALHRFFKPALLPSPHIAEMANITSPGSTPFEVEDFFFEDLPPHIKSLRKVSFGDLLPGNLKSLNARRRSDKLTAACKELTVIGAEWIRYLYEAQRVTVVLAFLPGLDQMKELRENLQNTVGKRGPGEELDIILMHSALDELDYRRALDPEEPGKWKVVIATNMAESSLTVPNVGAVVDFGMHRVNEYDDESKMSTLVTTWCSKASLKQRRGRTGRTCNGKCYKMLERRLYEQLEDFDQSGVERSSLTKVALEAAYLADVLSQPPQIRAGLPAILGSQGQRNVDFFDGRAGLWRISHEDLHGESVVEWAAEEDLQLAKIQLVDVLNLLPSPPKSTRINTAIADLQELGTLTFHERPTALGIACLKLPTEVQLARLVILGWTMGMGPSACVLAAALSLTPSCDVFRTPIKMQEELHRNDLELLKQCTDARSKYDEGYLSEPLLLYNLGLDWLKCGGGLGNLPMNITKVHAKFLHLRLWTQFSNKVVDLWRALQRLVPPSEPRTIDDLRLLQAVGRGVFRRRADPEEAYRILDNDKETLLALVTWGLAPGGFVAVGQSPCIYGKGSYGEFWKVTQENQWDVANCLYWKQSSGDTRQVLRELQNIGLRPAEIEEVEHDEKGETTKACILYYPPDRDPNPILDRKKQEPQKLLPQDFEMLYRLCAPFNGKANIANLKKVVSPVHPCAFNWYMPFRHRGGLKEVCVNWKCAAYSLLNDRRGGSRCRPKRFLVACGGDYRNQKHGDTKTRVIMLRGTSVLPSRDGGRQALLWFLSAGVPHDAQMTALCAPRQGLNPKDFEIRGLWMWERTFRLPDNAIITSHDLAAVNAFRAALTHLQSHQPHRLAGRWHDEKDKEATFHIDFFTENVEEAENDFLCVWQLNSPNRDAETKLYSVPGGWSTLQSDEQCILEELPEGKLRYGHRELSRSTEELAILEQLNPQSIQALRQAANVLLEVAKEVPQRRGPLPHRLVPLCSIIEGNALAPFDLVKVEERMTTFCEALSSQGWSEAEIRDMDGFQSPEEDEEMEVSDDVYLASQKNNEEYMWTLAERETEDPADCRYLTLPEDLLALPTAAVCAICEQSQQEGKHFSTRQLQKPIYDRLCEDCVKEKVAQEQGHTHPKAEKTILRRQ